MLTDIDKSSDDRGRPMPNTHDQLAIGTVMAKATNSVNYTSSSTNKGIIAGAKNGQLTIVRSGTVPISNWTDSAPIHQFKKGRFVHAQIPHNLPFIPFIVAYYVAASTYYNLPNPFMSTNGNPSNVLWDNWACSVDSQYIYFYTDYLLTGVSGISPSANDFFRYYLLQQTAT